MTRTDALGGLAAALLTFWGFWALADRPRIPEASQPLPAAAEVTHQPRPWRQPDPRTLTRFPGP
jgi:hypothetical protein